MANKITKVEIEKEEILSNIYHNHVLVETEESEKKVKIFSYYPDEISFTENELIGKTIQEACDLRHQKDVAYLKS